MRLSVLKRHRPAPPPGLPAGYSMGGRRGPHEVLLRGVPCVGCRPVRPRFSFA